MATEANDNNAFDEDNARDDATVVDDELLVVECVYPVKAESDAPEPWSDKMSQLMQVALGAKSIEYVGVNVHHGVHVYEFVAKGTTAMCLNRIDAHHEHDIVIKWKEDYYDNNP